MKKNAIPIVLALGAILFLTTSYRDVSRYTPVFMKRADLEKSVSYESKGRQMSAPGKIYVRGSELFINEKYKGVHIIDNSNPAAPAAKAFIVAPGCIDMAVKGNMIYLDNAVDLVAFDLDTKTVTERIKNFLPEHRRPDGEIYNHWDRPQDMILVRWKEVTDNE